MYSMREIIERYQKESMTTICPYNTHEEHLERQSELQRLVEKNRKLLQNIRQFTGEDMSSLSPTHLDQIEEQLMFSLDKVRNRKEQFLRQQVDNLHRKTEMLEDENMHYREVTEHDQQQYKAKVINDSLGPYHQLFPVNADRTTWRWRLLRNWRLLTVGAIDLTPCSW